MLTAAGVGSGLDVDSIVAQLMVLESRPLERLQLERSDVEIQISANAQFKSAISRLQSASSMLTDGESLGGVSGSSSDQDVLTVSANLTADPQSYDIEVTQVATNHRLASSALADGDTEVGSGDLTITVDGEDMTLSLASGNNTLRQIKDAINSAEDNPGVTASLINVDAGTQLVLTSNQTGTVNEISITKDSPGLDAFTLTQIGTLQDAELTIDGLDVTSDSNTLVDAIDGVTLTLQSAGTAEVSLATDSSSIANAVQSFVNEYNDLRRNISALRAGPMRGDSVLLSLESAVNRELTAASTLSDDSQAYLFELGMSFTDEGVLTLDQSELNELIADDPARALDIFGAESTGLAVRMESLLESYTEENGVLDARADALQSRTRGIDRLISNAEFRLSATEERLRAEFTALDTLIAQLNVTGNYLAQQIQNLPQIGGNDN